MMFVAVIQARLGSSRLPGKVLRPLHGAPLLERVVERAQRIEGLDRVVVATSVEAGDDPLADWCEAAGVASFRGDERDVLDRYWRLAEQEGADHILRITADCPLLSWEEAGRVVRRHLATGADYTHNVTVFGSGMPLGTGVEALTASALQASWEEGHEPHHREHVDEFVAEHPERFPTERVDAPPDLHRPDYRLTIDTIDDFALIDEILRRLDPVGPAPLGDVVALLDADPALAAQNRHVVQKRY